jgi:hypothetical protein
MNEMIERVARALCTHALASMPLPPGHSTDGFAAAKAAVIEKHWIEFAIEARVAIEAMREPPKLNDPYAIGYFPNCNTAAVWLGYIESILRNSS